MNNPQKILCVHKDIELYGSEKMFLCSVRAFRTRYPDAEITVALPFDGPLVEYLRPYCDEIVFVDMFILRRAELGPSFFMRIPSVQKKIKNAEALVKKHDLIYISTIVIFCFSIAAKLLNKPRFVHIHEMPTGIEAKIFSRFLRFCGLHGIAISQAVAQSLFPVDDPRVTVVHNGGTPPECSDQPWERGEKIKLLLIGRYNAWKGQPLLARAIAQLPKEIQDQIELRFVGSTFRGQEYFLDDLKELCATLPLTCTHSFHEFTATAGDCYEWADIVLVPSTNPEPFGLVAIEGMAFGKPVIGAGHGGLAEIVQPGCTGLLFAPNSPISLGQAITSYVEQPDRMKAHGTRGKQVFSEYYTLEAYQQRLIAAIENQQ